MEKLRPLLSLGIALPGGVNRVFEPALLDTGADDVLFPDRLASVLGIDLTKGTSASFATATGQLTRVVYADVELTVVAAVDHFVRWHTVVGFAQVSKAVFGFAGGLEYFHAGIDYALGRFSLIPRSNLPSTAAVFPAPTAAALRPM